jgi:sporulation protein YlmC with PRC-barrel domain
MPTASGHTTAIRAGKVIGTQVYDASGNRIGEIEDVMLEKTSNNIMFAVVGFGGFLGMGEKYHPVPWSELHYDEKRDGYTVSFTRDQLEKAPADSLDALSREDGRSYRDRAFDYYRSERYWDN